MRFHRVIILKMQRLRVWQVKPGRKGRDEMRFHCVIILTMPRLRIRQVKPGCNGRDAMRFHRVIILFETVSCLKPVARRGGFGNHGPPRGVVRSDAMNCGPPGVCLGSLRRCENQKRTRFRFLPITCPSKSVFPKLPCPTLKICIPVRNADGGRHGPHLSKSIKHRGIPCPDVLTNPVSHEKIWISVLFFFRCRRGEPRGVRTDVSRRGRRGYFARRHAAYRPGDAPAPKPPLLPHSHMPPKLSGGRRWMTRRKLFIVSELRSPSPGADSKAASDQPPSDCVLTVELRHIRRVG